MARLFSARRLLGAFAAAVFLVGCGRPAYVPAPGGTDTEEFYADPGRCGYYEWVDFERRRERWAEYSAQIIDSKLVALGHEVALVGVHGGIHVLDARTKSVKPLDIPDRVVAAERLDSRIWLLAESPDQAIKPAHLWSYAQGALELVGDLPFASCKRLLAIGGTENTLVVVTDRTIATRSGTDPWHLVPLSSSLSRNESTRALSFLCLDATRCLISTFCDSPHWAGGLWTIDVASGKVGRPRDSSTSENSRKAPGGTCDGHADAMIADPVDPSCALVAMHGWHSGENDWGCIARVCHDLTTLDFDHALNPPASTGTPWGIDVYSLAARGGRVFASARRGVYELGDGQARKLPVRFEPRGPFRVSYEPHSLIVLEVNSPWYEPGSWKVIAALDEE